MEQAENKTSTEKVGNVQRDSVQQQIYNARRKVQQGKTTSNKKQSSLIPPSILQNSKNFDSLSKVDKERLVKRMAGEAFERITKGKKLTKADKLKKFKEFLLKNKEMYLRSARTKYNKEKLSQKVYSNINAEKESINNNEQLLKQVSDNATRMEELQNSLQEKMSILAKSADQAAFRAQKVNMQRASLASSMMGNVIQQMANVNRQISNRNQEISNRNQEVSNRTATAANLIASANLEQLAVGQAQDALHHLQNQQSQAAQAAAQTAATIAAGQNQAAATAAATTAAEEQAAALQKQLADQAKAAAEQSAQQAAKAKETADKQMEQAKDLAEAQIKAAAEEGKATRKAVIGTGKALDQTIKNEAGKITTGINELGQKVTDAIAGLSPELQKIAASIAEMNNDLAKRLDELKGSTEEQIAAIAKAIDSAIDEISKDNDKIDQIVFEYSKPCPADWNWFHACLFYEGALPGVLVCAAGTGNHWFYATPDPSFTGQRSWDVDESVAPASWMPASWRSHSGFINWQGGPTTFRNGKQLTFNEDILKSVGGKGKIIGPKPGDGSGIYEDCCRLRT